MAERLFMNAHEVAEVLGVSDENQYKPLYLATIHAQLSAIFNYAIRFYRLKFNPANQARSMGLKKTYVIDSTSGCGLTKCGSKMVSIDNVITKDSELYRLYNTNTYEKMDEKRK